MKKRMWFVHVVAVMLIMTFVGTESVFAKVTTWTGIFDWDWNLPLNWTNGVPGADDDAVIPKAIILQPVIVIANTCLNLQIDTTKDDVTITVFASGTLTIADGGTIDVITAGVHNATITGDGHVLAGGTVTITNNSTGLLLIQNGTLTGTLANLITFTGSNDITVSSPIHDGAGTPITINMDDAGDIVTLSGANDYTGSTSINAGTLETSAEDKITDTSSVVLADAASALLKLGGNETIASLSGGGAAGGNINLQGNTLTVTQAADLTYAGVISGTGGLTKEGAFALTLSGANTYTGATAVNDGTINFDGVSTGASAVTASYAATKIAGTGTIPGTVTMNDGTILAPGATNGDAVGTLTITGAVTFNGESKYIVTVTGGNADKIVAGAALTATGSTPNIELGAGYSSAGLVVPKAIMTITGAYTAFDVSALPAGWVIDGAKFNSDIRITAGPGAMVPTLNEWGIIITLLLLAGTGAMMIRRRQQTTIAA